MANTNHWFAKPLPKMFRFILALQITSKKYRHGRGDSLTPILMALGYDKCKDFSSYQKIAVTKIFFGEKKSDEIREFFLDRYNDEDGLVDLLNKEISFRYFTKGKTKKDKTYVDAAVRTIINENICDFLGDEIF